MGENSTYFLHIYFMCFSLYLCLSQFTNTCTHAIHTLYVLHVFDLCIGPSISDKTHHCLSLMYVAHIHIAHTKMPAFTAIPIHVRLCIFCVCFFHQFLKRIPTAHKTAHAVTIIWCRIGLAVHGLWAPHVFIILVHLGV